MADARRVRMRDMRPPWRACGSGDLHDRFNAIETAPRI
jgi:hypothetical protein